ncbi:hypothetical protein L3X38_038625 [Prunus dulcis]|uniref:Uncharacterized protein n=1 Tax=Prunus dulcis TaxID=3755 RepID=A0AAD4V7Q6_PRUDU|nr:hypothetical protein L3X38_038625 [Prunus dulcis]
MASTSSSSSSSLSSLDLLADVATQQLIELLLDVKTVIKEMINFFAGKGREGKGTKGFGRQVRFELNDIFIPKKKMSRLSPFSLNMKTLKRKRECCADPNSSKSGSHNKKKDEGQGTMIGIAKANNWLFHVSDVSQLRFCNTPTLN